MRRIIQVALLMAACVTVLPAAAAAQEVRQQRQAELRQRAQERRQAMLQRLEQRHPQLAQRLQERRLQGQRVKMRPLARNRMAGRRLQSNRPEMFDRLDLNKDGVLSREEFLQRARGRTGRR